MRTIFNFIMEVSGMSNSQHYTKEYVKQKTSELYDSLPHDKEARMNSLEIRDQIIELNYSFFGYVASSTYVDNTTYEDKFQTALCSFLTMWWKYKWTPKYRDDLSFAVFFKPRISEEIRRYLSPVSYSVRRTLCMKAASQLNKHWSKVVYEDLEKIDLPANELNSLKVILGTPYPADLSEYELYLEAPEHVSSIEDYQTTKYDSIEELLIQEMIETESPINDKKLHEMAELYSIDYDVLKSTLPTAMQQLYKRLTSNK